MSNWTCSCGQVNSGNFCIGCGKVRPKFNIAAELQPPPPEKKEMSAIHGKTPIPPMNNAFSTSSDSAGISAKPSQNEVPWGNKKLVFGVVGCVLLVVIFAMFSGNDKPSTRSTGTRPNTTASTQAKPQTQQSQRSQQTQQSQRTQQTQEPRQLQQTQQSSPKKKVSNMSSDLGLGGICIGDRKKDVQALYGKEQKITDPYKNGHLHYFYSDIEVVIANGIVTGFVSNSPQVCTKRGIHEGSTLQDVLQAYGDSTSKFTYGDEIMYEYPFKSIDNKNCLLRFAIKNGRVDYISARTL